MVKAHGKETNLLLAFSRTLTERITVTFTDDHLRSNVPYIDLSRVQELNDRMYGEGREKLGSPRRETELDTGLTSIEAQEVYQTIHNLFSQAPEISKLLFTHRLLERECIKGKRCAVCLRYKDERCYTEC